MTTKEMTSPIESPIKEPTLSEALEPVTGKKARQINTETYADYVTNDDERAARNIEDHDSGAAASHPRREDREADNVQGLSETELEHLPGEDSLLDMILGADMPDLSDPFAEIPPEREA